MRKLIYIFAFLFIPVAVSAQIDRKEVRSGNRQFRREDYKAADISYRKALVKDSLSLAANYNLANVLYRGEHYDEAGKALETVKNVAETSGYGADYNFNVGDVALARKDYAAAVEAFKKSLVLNPGDLQAKENYIYAKKMLENQQKNGGGGGQDNQDNQDNQNNQDNQDNQQNQDNQDQQNDRNQDQQDNQDNQGGQDKPQDGQGQQPVNISPQQAQQMLKAVQAKEKETQDKVNKEKAEALKSRQKEKNW